MSNLGIPVVIPVPDIAAVIEDYTSIRLYRAPSQGGSYSLLTTLTLVAGQTAYTYQDTTGAATDWYRYSFYDVFGLIESALSEPVPAAGQPIVTRQELRRRTADRLGLYGHPRTNYTAPGPSGTTTAAGSTTTVVASAFASSRFESLDWQGWYCLLNSGAAAGEEREVESFSSGTFTVTPAYSAASGSGTTFDLYGEEPSSWWNERLEYARLHVWVPFQFPVAGVANQRAYALPDYISGDAQIFGLAEQGGATIRQYTSTPGAGFDVVAGNDGVYSLYFDHPLSANRVYYLSGRRHLPALSSDSATVALSERVRELFVTTAAQNAAQMLSDRRFGGVEDRAAWERLAARLELERRGQVRDLGLYTQQRFARRGPLVGVATGWER